ncbi:MAG: hypothetical protein IJ877_00410 [Candidatus Gastranaerophilales bacterium]|nr:hypothetical protein [Candidatus Gastranaerophilales bacterium]
MKASEKKYEFGMTVAGFSIFYFIVHFLSLPSQAPKMQRKKVNRKKENSGLV